MNEPDVIRTGGPGPVETVSIPGDQINEPGNDDDWSDWIRKAAGRASGQILALDLGDVTRLGSLGLNRLIQLNRVARQHGLEVTLVNVRPPIGEVLALTRMDRLFRPNPKPIAPIPKPEGGRSLSGGGPAGDSESAGGDDPFGGGASGRGEAPGGPSGVNPPE